MGAIRRGEAVQRGWRDGVWYGKPQFANET